MTPVGVNGAAGRMGMLLVAGIMESSDLTLAGATDVDAAFPSLAPGVLDTASVIIDFSLPEGTSHLLSVVNDDQALVVGTTGLGPEQISALRAHATRAPTVVATNFSTGVNLLIGLVEQAARALPDYHLEILEMHHGFKRDAPSGTALTLGRAAASGRDHDLEEIAVHGRIGDVGPRTTDEIGFHAIRGGDVAGEHTVYLAGAGERISLSHLATSRQAFAAGALRAARWAATQEPGLYTMRDVLGLG